jgi:hypothetical protein
MFIDANKIIELIEVCQDVKSRMSEENHRIHVDDIAGTLQKLLDDEAARLDKMAKDFEDEEYGQAVMENAAIEKELIMDFNWPGAI